MVATVTRQPLGQLLLGRRMVLPEQLDRALEEQRRGNHQKLLGEILVELQSCSEDQVVEVLAESYGVPYARITPRIVDSKAVSVLPRAFLEKHEVLPLFLVDNVLTVAVPEPANVFLPEEIERMTGHRVQIVAATSRDIRATLQAYLPTDQLFVLDEAFEDVKSEQFALIETQGKGTSSMEQTAEDAAVIRFVNNCIHKAVKEGASDIHIEPGNETFRVRYRIDGRLVEKLRPPLRMHRAIVARVKRMAGLGGTEAAPSQTGSISAMMDKQPVDLRVNSMPGRFGEKIVIRIIDNSNAAMNLEKLGFGYEALKQWRKLLTLPSGVVLVTGPAGSGKSTTLYAALRELNKDDVNICTIEDPIEHDLPGVNQFQVDLASGMTGPTALRALLRQDPDVIMLGRIDEPESARLTTQAALTGHLVFSTLHTTDAPSAINRLVNLGIEPYLVGATLSAVLAQRLVRKLCQRCKEHYTPTANERRQVEKVSADIDVLYRPRGCAHCRNLGFSGRIGIYELLVPDDQMLESISNGVTLSQLRELAHGSGLTTLRADGVQKVKAGITTLEEVYRVTA
jgi:type IV pilus assembly protein PilB